MSQVVHVTNGAAIAQSLAQAKLAPVVSWDDVLHEGPVPARMDDGALRWARASYMARMGWARREDAWSEMSARDATIDRLQHGDIAVLWFDTDLFDQLQLIQVLDRLSRSRIQSTDIRMVDPDALSHGLQPARARPLYEDADALPSAALASAAAAWAAFRSSSPLALQPHLSGPVDGLPHVRPALKRLVQEYPWTTDGLSLSRRRILEAARRELSLQDAFRAVRFSDPEPYLGDLVFQSYVIQLCTTPSPLVAVDDVADWDAPLRLTEAGEAVLGRREMAWRVAPIDRWIGGVRLVGEPRFQFDPKSGGIVGPGDRSVDSHGALV